VDHHIPVVHQHPHGLAAAFLTVEGETGPLELLVQLVGDCLDLLAGVAGTEEKDIG
jgi:hypothetical protein